MLTLVLGGARSGKSRYAESLCAGMRKVVYVATAIRDSTDAEMCERIERHRRDRPTGWVTTEASHNVAAAITAAEPGAGVIVDCATVWLSNLMWERRAIDVEARRAELLAEVSRLASAARERDVVIVSNEVGGGIVPENEIAREFRDLQGWANQLLAREAQRVVLVVAGLPLMLKDEPR